MLRMNYLLIAFVFFIIQLKSHPIEDPSSWNVREDLLFNSNGEPKNDFIKDLIEKLESDHEPGKKITRQEFLALLNRPEATILYKDALIKYATPKSFSIQEKEHQNIARAFMQKKKIKEGAAFLKKYSSLLSMAEKKYGVYKKDIVSILMWETSLGKYTGNYNVFNVFLGQILFLDAAQQYCYDDLIKQGKEDPFKDSSFKELEQRRIYKRKIYSVQSLSSLLRYCKQLNIDPLKQKGSWGGAIGFVQFMPFNLKYAVDADRDGQINLFSWADAFYSIGNYLIKEGNYKKTLKGRRKAIFAYNRSDEYVNGVIMYADAISKKSLR